MMVEISSQKCLPPKGQALHVSGSEEVQALPPLEQALKDYDALGRRRFHVPAHAGEGVRLGGSFVLSDPYRFDLTELDGLDVLSDPSGCLEEAQATVASLFRVAHSFFLVNGATVGLLAAMLACVRPGEKVLLPRNVHRSVLSGLVLNGAVPVWILPERYEEWGLWGAVSVEAVRNALDEQPDIKALFVTSPTYEGLGSDIVSLSELCRSRDVLLIVDEAHGSLWPFSGALPQSAVHSGADVVVHSMHKSGGCLTQGALAHLPHQSRVTPAAYQQALNLVQTTSPSYLLMASLESACHFLASEAGQTRLNRWADELNELRQTLLKTLTGFRLFEADAIARPFWDPAKLYLLHPNHSGEDWGAMVEEDLQLSFESASPYGVLYLANLGLEDLDFKSFSTLLKTAARLLDSPSSNDNPTEEVDAFSRQAELEAQNPAILIPDMAMTPRDAMFSPGGIVPPQEAIGRVSKQMIVRCPPGIPVLMPGERVLSLHQPFLPEAGLQVVNL